MWGVYYLIVKQAMDRQQEEDDAYYRHQKEKKEKGKKEKEYFHNSHDCCDCPNFDSDQYEMVNGELKHWCKLRKCYCASYFSEDTPEAVWYTGECEEMRKEKERLRKEKEERENKEEMEFLVTILVLIVLGVAVCGLVSLFS